MQQSSREETRERSYHPLYNKRSYHFATGNERIRLASFQVAMKTVVVTTKAMTVKGRVKQASVCVLDSIVE